MEERSPPMNRRTSTRAAHFSLKRPPTAPRRYPCQAWQPPKPYRGLEPRPSRPCHELSMGTQSSHTLWSTAVSHAFARAIADRRNLLNPEACLGDREPTTNGMWQGSQAPSTGTGTKSSATPERWCLRSNVGTCAGPATFQDLEHLKITKSSHTHTSRSTASGYQTMEFGATKN